MKRKKKMHRRLMGVGHPYFAISYANGVTKGAWPDALALLDANF